METNPSDDIMLHSLEMREKIENYKKEIEDCQKQFNELEKQSVPNNQKVLNVEINKLFNLVNNPKYEYQVEEKQEIIDSLEFFADEYKSLIKEIQDALNIIKSNP